MVAGITAADGKVSSSVHAANTEAAADRAAMPTIGPGVKAIAGANVNVKGAACFTGGDDRAVRFRRFHWRNIGALEQKTAGDPPRREFDGLKFFSIDCNAMARAPQPDRSPHP